MAHLRSWRPSGQRAADLAACLLGEPRIASHPIAPALLPLLCEPTGISSSGYPYVASPVWEHFRDTIPILFRCGLQVLACLGDVESTIASWDDVGDDMASTRRACGVARQVVLTGCITAPSDLWILRQVLSTLAFFGITEALLAGDAIVPSVCACQIAGREVVLDAQELDTDLHFLLARGMVEQYDQAFRIAGHPQVHALLRHVEAAQPGEGDEDHPLVLWQRLFAGECLEARAQRRLATLASLARPRRDLRQNHWIPHVEEVDVGFCLLPVVLALRACGLGDARDRGTTIAVDALGTNHPELWRGAMAILVAAGWLEPTGEHFGVTELGERGFRRAAGPFGIIAAYHRYLRHGVDILLHGRRDIWVSRAENVGASQDANRASFRLANDLLDRFCRDTGFRYGVFIEHAIGRGEATRQRFGRPGGDGLRYVGADLEDAAIEAAVREQQRGALPPGMIFVRRADIGRPHLLIDAMVAAGISPHGAVMLVGNGFHEVRDQDDAGMVAVFQGYHDAGILLIFTEESALSVDDLRATAWNTYHAGFKYVHEKSRQELRPAERAPLPSRLGHPLRAPWTECARRAGYVRATRYCHKSRTIYPSAPPGGHNPSVHVIHFFVPASIAQALRF